MLIDIGGHVYCVTQAQCTLNMRTRVFDLVRYLYLILSYQFFCSNLSIFLSVHLPFFVSVFPLSYFLFHRRSSSSFHQPHLRPPPLFKCLLLGCRLIKLSVSSAQYTTSLWIRICLTLTSSLLIYMAYIFKKFRFEHLRMLNAWDLCESNAIYIKQYYLFQRQ